MTTPLTKPARRSSAAGESCLSQNVVHPTSTTSSHYTTPSPPQHPHSHGRGLISLNLSNLRDLRHFSLSFHSRIDMKFRPPYAIIHHRKLLYIGITLICYVRLYPSRDRDRDRAAARWRRLPFQAIFRAAQVGPWRRLTPGSISYRDKYPHWNTRWPATSDWSWACFSRHSIHRETAPASRWCREPRQPARGRAAVRPLWSRDRRASLSHRQFRATETGRFNPARRMVCSGKHENKWDFAHKVSSNSN